MRQFLLLVLGLTFGCSDPRLADAPLSGAACEADTCPQDSQDARAEAPPLAYNTPMGLVTEGGVKSVRLTWIGIKEATSYDVFWSHRSGVDETAERQTATSPEIVFRDLAPENQVFFRVRAQLPGGASSLSIEIAGEPLNMYYVDARRSDDSGDGSQEAPKKTIQAAIDIGNEPVAINVAQGTYTENVRLKPGMQVFGGFNGANWQRNPSIWRSIIRDTRSVGGTSMSNPIRTVEVSAGDGLSVLDGFEIHAADVAADRYAAAVFASGAKNAVIQNCVVSGGVSGLVTLAVVVQDGKTQLTKNTIHGGGGSYSMGLALLGTAQAEISGNVLDGGTGTSGSYGFNDYGSGNINVTQNQVAGGSGLASYGIRLASIAGDKTIANNFISAGQSHGFPTGIELNAGTAASGFAYLRNNTITMVNALTTMAIGIKLGTHVEKRSYIENNVIGASNSAVLSYCIYEDSAQATPFSVRNNNVYGCQTAVYRDFQTGACNSGQNCTTVAAMEALDDVTASGNLSEALNYGDDFNLISVPSNNIRYGGLDGKSLNWNFFNDYLGKTRTRGLGDEAANFGAGGWSIGAVEID